MQLYVGNLDYGVTEQGLTDLFTEFGEVVSSKIIIDRETGRSKGFGFIEMGDKSSGIEAISQLNGQEVNGRNIKVNEAQQKPSGGGGGGRDRRW